MADERIPQAKKQKAEIIPSTENEKEAKNGYHVYNEVPDYTGYDGKKFDYLVCGGKLPEVARRKGHTEEYEVSVMPLSETGKFRVFVSMYGSLTIKDPPFNGSREAWIDAFEIAPLLKSIAEEKLGPYSK